MKKYFIFMGLCILSMSLTACGVDNFSKDEPDTVSKQGILLSQRTGDDYLGTHLLNVNNGDVVPLRSVTINLSDSNYLENEVEVLGFTDENDDVFQVTGVRVLEILTKVEEEVEFVKYKNTEFGFEWKYYNDWEVEPASNSISFISPNNDRVMVSQQEFTYIPTVSDEGESDTPLSAFFSDANMSELDMRKIGVDRMDAVRVESEAGVLDYYVYRSGFVYVFGFVPAADNTQEAENVFHEMLLEFKFTGFTVDPVPENSSTIIEESTQEIVEEIVEEIPEDSTEPETTETSDPNETIVQHNEEVAAPVSDFELTSFESLPYSFSGSYPNQWYYAGVNGGEGVLHHYGFSDESVTEDNEILSMDVISASNLPNGQEMNVSGRNLTLVESGDDLEIYIIVDEQGYRLSGDSEYRDLMINMLLNIRPIVTE